MAGSDTRDNMLAVMFITPVCSASVGPGVSPAETEGSGLASGYTVTRLHGYTDIPSLLYPFSLFSLTNCCNFVT